MNILLSKEQAAVFLLMKQGLTGDYRFSGKDGVVGFVKQAGCVQYDPLNICGRNADLTFHSRVEGFTKAMLWELLYEDRVLIDYWDKNMSILLTEDWPQFGRIRNSFKNKFYDDSELDKVYSAAKSIILKNGSVCSSDLDMNNKIDWYWAPTSLGRAGLEALYHRGELVIHHKSGTKKYYALAEDTIPRSVLSSEDMNGTDEDFYAWCVKRRIGAVGMLRNKASDAWLGLHEFKAKDRQCSFYSLLNNGSIVPVEVEGIKEELYILKEDEGLLIDVLSGCKPAERTEAIAPLDNFMWDRKLIQEIFGFEYKWEVYTPVNQRKYGHYVLPVISGSKFVGRIEAVCDKKTEKTSIRNFWWENNVKRSKSIRNKVRKCAEKLAEFNGCKQIVYDTEDL